MKALLTFILALALTGLVALAQEAAPEAFDEKQVPALGPGIVAQHIREGQIAIDQLRTMEMGGRFHTIHTKFMAMACASCHQGVEFPKDALFLRKNEFPVVAQPGVVDRFVCMGCHRGEGAIATQIYGVDPR